VLSGTADPSSVVNVFDGDAPFTLDLNDTVGTWRFATDILDRTESFTVEAADLFTHVVAEPAGFDVTLAPSPITDVTIAEGDSAEINGPGTQSVTFTGTTGTLTIDRALAFTGQISGLAGTDALDLADISYGANTTATFLGNTTGGALTVTDGIHTANIALSGNYLSSGWTLSSDGQGGTVVVDPVPVNAWKELKIGAGGYLTGIDIAPDNTMVVRTDTYGAYIWNGTQWQQLVTSASMPASYLGVGHNDGVYEISIAPSNTNILYMEYSGDLLRSDDRGATWTKTAFANVAENAGDPYRTNGQKMAVDPNNPNVVYVGTPQNGMFVTTDGGATWQNVTAVPVSATDANGLYPGITGITFDPTSGVNGGKTNTIYASSYGHGVYESTDGGNSWTALGGPSDVEYAAISSTGAYYAIGNNGTSLWRFMNGTWTELNQQAFLTASLHTVMVDPFNPNHIVVAASGGALNQSLDGGATWTGTNWGASMSATDVPWLATTEPYMASGGMAFDQLVQNKLWFADGVGVWNTSVPQNLLWNTPVVWNSQSAGIEQLVANEIVVAPGGKPVLASWDRSFFYVSDPNSYPSTYGVGDPTKFSAGWSIDYASSSPSFLVGINDWWGVEQSGYSTDGGQTWHMFPTMPSFAGTTIGGTIAASSPTDIVWAPADGVAPQYTKDGGLTWHPVVLPGVTDWSAFDWAYYLDKRTVTADRVLPDTFYMYYNGVFKSTDGGATWTKVFTGEISSFSNFNSRIEAVPGKAGNLFFTGGPQGGTGATHPAGESFFQSTDGGATWTAVPNVLEVQTFGFGAPATAGGYPSIYIVGWVNSVYGIWQSNDDAKSWTQIGDYPEGSLDQIKTIAGDPNIYGQVYVGFSGSGYAYLPATPAGPTPTSIVESPSSGDLNAGKMVTLTLNLSGAVTVAGGTPTLTLNDGGTATYTGGSGSNALTFSYTVGAGQNTAALAATAVNLNGATVKDGSGNAANFLLTGLTQTGPQIDTATPVISAITESPSSGALNAGKIVTYTLTMNEVVTVNTTGGSPTLTFNDGGTATYVSGSGTNALTFSYLVLAGQNTPDLMVSAVNLNAATLRDGAGNAANLSLTGVSQGSPQIDTTPPSVTQVIASPANGTEFPGNTVTFTLAFGEAVTVTGTPTLTLNDGGTATYLAGTGTNALTFTYTVGSGDATGSALAITQANLPNGATITDGAGNAANLSGALTTFPNLAIGVDQAPVVTTSAQYMMRNQTIAASSLFTATDPDGDAITIYALKDPSGHGYFVVNGVIQASNTEIDLTAAQLAQTTYVSGRRSEQVSVRVSDGTLWSAWQTVSVNVAARNEKAPVVTTSSLTTLAGQTFAASSLFSVSDSNGDPIVTYALNDATGGSGYFVVNGVVQPSNTEIDLTAAQLAQTIFVTGSGTDQLSVRASDGWLWSNWQSPAVNVSPTPVINAGATLELASAYPGTVTFASTTGTLKLDNSASFAGTVAGMAGSDTLDLADINFATTGTASFSGTSTGGTLTVTDGSHTANIALTGNYLSSTWTLSSDGNGGTFVVDPPATSPVLSPSGPAAPVTNALDQPVVTSPGMATVSKETGATLPPPSIGSTTKDNAGLLGEVPCTTDCEVAQSKNLQSHDAAIAAPPIGSKRYAIDPPFLSLSFDSGRAIAPGESAVAIASDDEQHNVIALLSQYTAAGFHARGDAGAMVSPATTASTSEAVLALFAQPFEKPPAGNSN
jgi:hypothetical protein